MIIELKFVKSPADIDTMVGMPITLRCQVTGKHQPKISWNKDNKPLESKHVIMRKESIRIRSAVPTDQGTYTCVAKNELGTIATRDAKVTVSTGMYNIYVIMYIEVQEQLFFPEDPPSCGQRKMPDKAKRIIGGDNATTHWPWQVRYIYPKPKFHVPTLYPGVD